MSKSARQRTSRCSSGRPTRQTGFCWICASTTWTCGSDAWRGLAAELATGLSAGEPCPVCGSGVHPAPAVATDVVSLADIRAAEVDQNRATEAASLIRSTVSAEKARGEARAAELAAQHEAARVDRADAERSAAEPTSAAQVRAALAAGEAVLTQVRLAASALAGAQAEMVTLALAAEQLRGLADRATAARASALALAAASREQCLAADAEVKKLLAGHRQTCPCEPAGRGPLTGVAGVISRHEQALEDARCLAAGLEELVTQTTSAEAAALRLSTALQDHRLESIEQAQAAVLPGATVTELTALMRTAE